MTEETGWPKPWKRILTENSDYGVSSFKRDWVEFDGGVRGYKETLYVSESAGRVNEDNVDAWMPFEVYIKKKVEEL